MRSIFVLIIACVIGGVGFSVTADWDRGHALRHERSDFRRTKIQLAEIAKHLRKHHQTTGRYPTNDEGLRMVGSFREIGDDWSNPICRFVTEDGNVLSIWGEPFVYENRSNLPAKVFVDSGATLDDEHRYSIQVDKDVYVWSLGAQTAYRSYRKNYNALVVMRVLFFGSSLLCLLLYVRQCSKEVLRDSWCKRLFVSLAHLLGGGIVALILSPVIGILLAGLTGGALARTCYECYIAQYPDIRTPAQTREYIGLLDKFRERGIISDNAYTNIIRSMNSNK